MDSKVQIKKADLSDPFVVDSLLELSRVWVEEGSCFGMRANERDDLKEPCYIALEGGKVIGYGFGHFYEKETKNSEIPVGSKCFEIDELYVLPEYRSGGIGGEIFRLLEEEAKDKAEFITLATSTKDYKKALRFYAEQNAMTYHSAYLIKKI